MITTLSQLVGLVESGNCMWAMRYEPAFKPSEQAIKNCIAAHAPAYMNRSTAEVICKTSWGEFQIMGENLYTICGLKEPISFFINDEGTQENAYHAHNKAKGIDYDLHDVISDVDKRLRFARRYNGSTTYGNKLLSHYRQSN